jgi:hypothetical protein
MKLELYGAWVFKVYVHKVSQESDLKVKEINSREDFNSNEEAKAWAESQITSQDIIISYGPVNRRYGPPTL